MGNKVVRPLQDVVNTGLGDAAIRAKRLIEEIKKRNAPPPPVVVKPPPPPPPPPPPAAPATTATTTTTTTTTTAATSTTSEPPAPPPPPPLPPSGQVSGTTPTGYSTPKVKLPGTNEYVDLEPGMVLPPGTVVDLSDGGGIQLTNSDGQQMTFYGEGTTSSQITISGQLFSDRPSSGSQAAKPPVENIVLTGGNFNVCKTKSLRAGKTPPPIRKVWGHGKGNYRTKGRFAAATVLGTWWATVDRCDGTLIIVKQGIVSVRDLLTKKDHRVTAGHSYLVKAPKPKPKK